MLIYLVKGREGEGSDTGSPPPPINPAASGDSGPSHPLPTDLTLPPPIDPTPPPALIPSSSTPLPTSTPVAAAGSQNQAVAGAQNQARKRLSNKQKNDVRQVNLDSALAATAEAASKGTPRDDAIKLGKTVGAACASSFANAVKQGNNNTGTVGTAAAMAQYPPMPRPRPAPRVANRSKLAKSAPYKHGNAASNGQNMVTQKPMYKKNKCLVIRGLRKDASETECVNYIDKTAGRKIDLLHMAILSREYSPWLTIAIELNDTDYELLSDCNIWEKSIAIRDYVGWRSWHGKRLAPHEIKNSVRMSWEKTGGPTL